MKKKWIAVLFILLICVCVTGCAATTTTVGNATEEEKAGEVSLTYSADFYDNFGGRWLSVEGKTFSISPNKIKTYSWDSDGSWISSYEMSSVMSIGIDGNKIESCGSTVIFSDSRLEKCDIDFNTEISTGQSVDFTDNSSISQPSDVRMEDWFKIRYWWYQKSLNNSAHNTRLVIIQSQLGNPICVYSGDDVSWDVPKNLPKTTMVTIDGKVLYIHRANFSIIDTSLLEN
ncbi:MAG: DUF5052 family protein [Lachnospiraceae bacterium]|nr:DUF5052 family protein [Lachnospiraceae bacterium]